MAGNIPNPISTNPGSIQIVNFNVLPANLIPPIFPSQTLLQVIGADASTGIIELRVFGASHGLFEIWAATGTASAPGALTTDFHIGSYAGGGFNGTSWGIGGEASANMQYFAAENWNVAAQGTYILLQTTKKLTTTLRAAMRIQDDGGIGVLFNSIFGGLTGANVSAYGNTIQVVTILGPTDNTTNASRAVLELVAGAGNTANNVGQIDFTKTQGGTAILAQIFTGFSGAGGKIHFRVRTTAGALTDWWNIDQNGNLIGLAGAKVVITTTGAAASAGQATLSAGTVTISTTAVTANSKVFFSLVTPGGVTIGTLQRGTIVAGTSFVVNSVLPAGTFNAADTSTFDWWLIN